MRAAFIIIILKIIFLSMTFVVIYELNKGNLNKPIKYALEFYLRLKSLDATVNNLQIQDKEIRIESIMIKKDDIICKLNDIVVIPHFDFDYKNSKFFANITFDKVKFLIDKNKEFFTSSAHIIYNSYLIKRKSEINIDLNKIIYNPLVFDSKKDISNIQKNDYGNIKISYLTTKNRQQYFIKGALDKTSFVDLNLVLSDDILASGTVKNIPNFFYKPLYYIQKNNEFFKFLDEFIKSGDLAFAEFNINLTKQDIQKQNYNSNNIKASGKFENLKFFYHEDLPPITDMEIDLKQQGSNTEFIINKAKSTNILISNGIISIDWKGDDTNVIVSALGSGPVNALVDLIPEYALNRLNKSDINLKTISGTSSLSINLTVPLSHEKKNTYDINANIIESNLSIFNNSIILNKAKLFAKYTGDTLILDGDGKINGFDSKINFHQNFTDKNNFNYKLNIVSNIFVNSSKSQAITKLPFITLYDGYSKLKFEYINIKDEDKISLNADLKNLNFYFDKLGIHKNKNKNALFEMEGKIDDANHYSFKFSLTGENKLDIKGSIDKIFDDIKIIINKLKFKDTNLSSELSIHKDFMNIDIKGKSLDLSSANMMQFLQKERDSGRTHLQMNIDKIKLKNNIWFDDLKLHFKCNHVKCYKGFIDAFVGSRTVEMVLKEESNSEQWLIKSTNAGAVLKAFGAYNDMRAGEMLIIINASRKEIKTGEFISLLDGSFKFDRFVLHNAHSLSKLISVTSLPGLVRLVSGNEDIIFSNMSGDFNFQKGILNILHSSAKGPFFGFTMSGEVNLLKNQVNLKGYVNPSFYGASTILGSVPIIGRIFGGNGNVGIISAPYSINESY